VGALRRFADPKLIGPHGRKRPSFDSNRQEKIMEKLGMRPTGHALDVGV
jgi:hypothetical protein